MSDHAAPTRTRSPLGELLVLAAPTIATMTSFTVMQFIDKLMVARIGPDPVYVGAQGNGGLAAFVPIAAMMGLITVINTYVSQNLGAGRPDRAPAYAWNGVWMSVAFWLLVLIPFSFVLPTLFRLIRETPQSTEQLTALVHRDQLAAEYGRILLLGSVITMACRGISQYFYGMHRPMIVLIAGLAGNITNLVANSFFIYGPDAPAAIGNATLNGWFAWTSGVCESLGIPAFGVAGAAIGTVIGTTVELAIPMIVFVSPAFNRRYGTLARGVWKPSRRHIRDIFRIGWPGAVMFGSEMICWSFFMVYLVGGFGPRHSTAGWIAHQWMSLSFMPAVGLSVAITATVGKCLGMKRPDLAAHRAWLGVGLSVTYMTLCGVVFVVFRREMVGLFIQPDTAPADAELILTMGSRFLIAVAAFQFFDGLVMSLSGALRGAGDTRWVGVVTVVLAWSVIVLGGLGLVTYFPKLGSLGPWIAAAAYITLLALATLWRWSSGRWQHIRLIDHESADAPPREAETPALVGASADE